MATGLILFILAQAATPATDTPPRAADPAAIALMTSHESMIWFVASSVAPTKAMRTRRPFWVASRVIHSAPARGLP